VKKNFRSFVEARTFVRTIGLKNQREWQQVVKTGKIPKDIPHHPHKVYKNKGWINLGDFLGTRNISNIVKSKNWKSFKEARKFIRSLGLKSEGEWQRWCRTNERPADIPFSPEKIYKKEWTTMGNWFGTGRIASQLKIYKPFEDARDLARSLGLNTQKEWYKFSKSKEKPDDIPTTPDLVYKNKGWKSMGDWLGTGRIADQWKQYRNFNEAKKFIHSLGLKNQKEWGNYAKSDKKPNDIPATPHRTYQNQGWTSSGDWLGTGYIANRNRQYKSFVEARNYIRTLKLKNQHDWNKFVKSNKKPNDIPTNPNVVYKNKGWKRLGDFLGTGNISNIVKSKNWKSFKEARKYARSLGLKSLREWNKFAKSTQLPSDIPIVPWLTYQNQGWTSSGDWLGTGKVADQLKQYRPFSEARMFIHSLGLKNQKEWFDYCKSGKKPVDIPTKPWRTYSKKRILGKMKKK